MPELKPDTHCPSDEEEAAINAGIAADPDTFELDDAWFANARPASEVLPHIVGQWRLGKLTLPGKESSGIPADGDGDGK